MKQISKHALLFLAGLMVLNFVLSSCESKDPSVLKVFVHDESNAPLPKAQVIIIGDTKSNPPTIDYVDTLFTDNLGVAIFNMEDFFTASGKEVTSGYFDILVKYLNEEATGRVRVKEHITSVQSVYFEP
jgi:hypothetical protein